MNIETLNFNSFKVMTVEKETDIVALLLSADVHFENSAKQQALLSIYADMLQAGAGKYNRDDFLYEVSSIGMNLETNTTEGRIIISMQVLQNNLNKALGLLEAVFLKPLFAESELARVKQRLSNSLVLYKENSRLLAFDNLKRELYGEKDRKYRNTPENIGLVINDVFVEDLNNLHSIFRQSFWKIGLGGNNKSIKAVTKTLEKIKKESETVIVNTPTIEPKEVKTAKLVTIEVPSKKNIDVSFGMSLPFTIDSEDFPAFNFGLTVLGKWGGFAGRLMSTVREKEGLTYAIYARNEGVGKEETGFLWVFSFFSPKDIEAGMTSVVREFKKIQEKGITESELKSFRTILKTGDTLVRDSLVAMVTLVHGLVIKDLDYSDYEKYLEKVYTCSRVEINKALKQYLRLDRMVLSLAGPTKEVKIGNLKKIIKAK